MAKKEVNTILYYAIILFILVEVTANVKSR